MKKILIIEDEKVILKQIASMLEFEGYKPLEALGGKIGIEMAREELPDMIICDIMMPVVDGYMVLTELHKDPETASIPFIFLTARANRPDLRYGMELGADDYITKPFTSEELVAAVSTRIEKQGTVEKTIRKKIEELRNCIAYSLPHEFRSPLNGILGFSDILIESYETMDRNKINLLAREINKSGKRLSRLIDNFLLYAELTSIKNRGHISKVSATGSFLAKEFIEHCALSKARLEGREKDLIIELCDCSVNLSEQKLYKIIEELLDNAFKFSSHGENVILKSTCDENKIKISVIDSGRGMQQKQIDEIGAYMQFERNIYEQQGAGLGLAIVKLIVNLAGGEFLIKSKYHKGTEIHILLPLFTGEERIGQQG